MNKYYEKAEKIKKHLRLHPHDYQSVIVLFIAESKAIAFDRRQKRNMMMAEIARYRRESNAQ